MAERQIHFIIGYACKMSHSWWLRGHSQRISPSRCSVIDLSHSLHFKNDTFRLRLSKKVSRRRSTTWASPNGITSSKETRRRWNHLLFSIFQIHSFEKTLTIFVNHNQLWNFEFWQDLPYALEKYPVVTRQKWFWHVSACLLTILEPLQSLG